jgi:hypothetical protein
MQVLNAFLVPGGLAAFAVAGGVVALMLERRRASVRSRHQQTQRSFEYDLPNRTPRQQVS